jgi:hypothetical protein
MADTEHKLCLSKMGEIFTKAAKLKDGSFVANYAIEAYKRFNEGIAVQEELDQVIAYVDFAVLNQTEKTLGKEEK